MLRTKKSKFCPNMKRVLFFWVDAIDIPNFKNCT